MSTTALNKDSKIVLKLDLGEDGIRRIPVAKLWDDSCSSVSYDRLFDLVVGFKALKPKAVQNGRIALTTTYMDEDGDEITISSDEELTEAFDQFLTSVPPVLRAKAIAVTKAKKNGGAAHEKNKNFTPARTGGIEDTTPVAETTSTPIEVASAVPKVHVPDVNKETSDAVALGCNPDFIHGRHTCDGCLSTPILGFRYHAVNLPDYDLCANCHKKYVGSEIKFKPMQLDRDRHLQARWQRRQVRRCRRAENPFGVKKIGGSEGGKATRGLQTKKVINNFDDDLKEAIRRSLVDAWPKSKNNKATDQLTHVEDTFLVPISAGSVGEVVQDTGPPLHEDPEYTKYFKMLKMGLPVGAVKNALTRDGKDPSIIAPVKVMEEEKDIPVARVVEVSAGDDLTQHALDAMNPKVKDALSRSLNKFFTRRLSRNKDDYKDLELSPDIETQKKIDTMDAATKEAISRSLNQFIEKRRVKREDTNRKNVDDSFNETQKKIDSMDVAAKEAIRRSLTQFFENRRASTIHVEKEVTKMDAQTKESVCRSLNDFFTDRSKELTRYDEEKSEDILEKMDAETKESVLCSFSDLFADRLIMGGNANGDSHGVQSVDVDIVVDDNEDTSGVTVGSKDDDEAKSITSEGDAARDEWQMIVEDDEMIAVAAQMLGSALYNSDSSLQNNADKWC